MKYAVVGFGTAGYHAVKKIRELDKEGCIAVYINASFFIRELDNEGCIDV